MGSNTLALDSILSATFYFTPKWSSHLQSNKARDLLRYVVCRLYDAGRGNLINAELTFAQTSLAKKLGMSRQWIGELGHRLVAQGWLESSSEKLPDGTNGSTIWRVGRMLKRLIVMLTKSTRGKSLTKPAANSRWQFSPQKREKEVFRLLTKENEPPKAEMLERMPLLKRWLARGKP